MDKRVRVTKPLVGVAYMQVCAVKDATNEEILEVCNRENARATRMVWIHVVRENEPKEHFWTTEHMRPVSCSNDPERVHFLVFSSEA